MLQVFRCSGKITPTLQRLAAFTDESRTCLEADWLLTGKRTHQSEHQHPRHKLAKVRVRLFLSSSSSQQPQQEAAREHDHNASSHFKLLKFSSDDLYSYCDIDKFEWRSVLIDGQCICKASPRSTATAACFLTKNAIPKPTSSRFHKIATTQHHCLFLIGSQYQWIRRTYLGVSLIRNQNFRKHFDTYITQHK